MQKSPTCAYISQSENRVSWGPLVVVRKMYLKETGINIDLIDTIVAVFQVADFIKALYILQSRI